MKRVFIVSLMMTAVVLTGTSAPGETGPNPYPGMFGLYEDNREKGIGNYITADFILTAYNLFVRDLMTSIEEKTIYPAYGEMIKGLMKRLRTEKKESRGHKTALAYVTVLQKLLDPKALVPKEVSDRVHSELKLINEHKGINPSAVTGVKEDYSQYVLRGKYTRSESLKNYFRAVMYGGRMGFYLKESKATGVTSALADEYTEAALMMSRILLRDARLKTLYNRIQALLNFFVGTSDDLTPGEYIEAAGMPSPKEARKRILVEMKRRGRLPRIISVPPADRSRLEPDESMEEAVMGLRLMGQRYTPASDAFQNLVYDRVTDYRGKGSPFTMALINGEKVRGFPTVLDLMAALGSEKAMKIMKGRGDTDYENYETHFKAASSLLRGRAYDPSSLSSMHLKIIDTLLQYKTGEGLNGALGLWIQNRHNLLLYSKQSYTVVAKSVKMYPKRESAYIEPAVGLYDDLIEALYGISQALERGELTARVNRFRKIIKSLRALAYKQEVIKLEQKDCDYLNSLDRLFGQVVSETDRPVVVDIHTEPNSGMVLEEATGYPIPVFYEQLRGARFNCYEFKHPADRRLTDEAWQEILKKGEAEGSLSENIL